MKPSKTSALETEVSELKSLVNNLLNKVEKQDALIRKLTAENSSLHEEVRHLRRLKLLLILEHPWLPLHNNLSERQIREYVKRRKISGGTRSILGRKCRDTFASLKKTCRLHGVSFSRYLKDRISGEGMIARLSDMVREKSAQLMSTPAYEF
ncbi:IS66 family transposase [Endozoicomonas numazuensis]|uniref:IS66 family transposase n=1 Tax=Endozoicomonas numazuensis TaxID=1137799 RepID=UPI00068FE336|nr:transposase [Endozoicomonas numazuensis]